MQVVIETSDRKEVQRVARQYFGVELTPAHAEEVIRSSVAVQVELLQCGGSLQDTAARDRLGDALVELAFKGRRRPKNTDAGMGYTRAEWHWPCNGSSDEYADEFDKAWHKAVVRRGWSLTAEGVQRYQMLAKLANGR